MENERVNQQPTYEQLIQAYTAVVQENQQLKTVIQSLQIDRTLERMKTIMQIIENKEKYPEQAVKCAEGYLLYTLAPEQEVKTQEESK